MKAPFFSILIPVYNVENYLEVCLNSVLKQTFRDFEVIMMDDGSTDNSKTICNEFIKKDNRFKLYSQNNKGLLLTRRKLFELSNGKYIISLDSDDFIENNMLQILYDEFTSQKAEMILFRHNVTDDEGNKIKESIKLFEHKMVFNEGNKKQILEVFFTSSSINSICFKAVKRSLLDIEEDYSHYKDIKGEDALQSIALFRDANLIVYINDCLSNYRSSINNRTNNFKSKYFDDFNIVQSEIFKFMKTFNSIDHDLVEKFFKYYFAVIRIYLNSALLSLKDSEFKHAVEQLKDDPFFIDGVNILINSNTNFHDKLFIKVFFMKKNFILIKYIRMYTLARKLYNRFF